MNKYIIIMYRMQVHAGIPKQAKLDDKKLSIREKDAACFLALPLRKCSPFVLLMLSSKKLTL